MAIQGRIILLVLVVLLAGCAQDDTVVDTNAASETSPTTTVAPTTTTTTSTTTTPSTTTTAATTTSASSNASTTTTTRADQLLPAPFGTMDELYELVNPDRLYPMNTRVVNSIGFSEGEKAVAEYGPDAWEWWSLTITHFEGLTVWESDDGHRAARKRGELEMFLDEDGTWYTDDTEGNPFGFPMEWEHAQFTATSCIDHGAEAVGFEEIVGSRTLHIACQFDVGGRGSTGSQDVWIDEHGYVMKSYSEIFDGPASGVTYVWEVTGLNIEPTGPLPPGW